MEDVNSVVLESAVAILCGGVDQNGCPLIIFPTDAADLIDVYAAADILGLLKALVGLAGTGYGGTGSEACTGSGSVGHVAVVADLRHGWSEDCVTKLTTLLDKLQSQTSDCITVAYFVKPHKRSKTRLLDSQLTRLQSPGQLTTYQMTRVECVEELYNYIDKSQLTSDYGGTMNYDHVAWVEFYKKYISVLKVAEQLKATLPAINEDIANIDKRMSRPDDAFSVRMKKMKAKYEAILKRYSVRETIARCKAVLEILDNPDDDQALAKIDPSLLVHTTSRLRGARCDLDRDVKALDAKLAKKQETNQMNERLEAARRHSKEVIETIILMTHNFSDLPRIGRRIEEAQDFRNEFIEETLGPSKDIVECGTTIMQNLATDKNTTPKTYKASLEIATQLTEALQPFTARINKLNETYTRIHMFYVIHNKVARWKEKASNFIEDTLVPLEESHCNHHCPRLNGVPYEEDTCFNNTLCPQRNGRPFEEDTCFDHSHMIHRCGEDSVCHTHCLQRNDVSCEEGTCCDRVTNCHHRNNLHGEDTDGQSHYHEQFSNNNACLLNGSVVEAPSSWDERLDHFYHKHPPPNRKHLRLITKFLSDFIDKPQLIEAETLAERTMFILAFLRKDSFKGEDIVRILQWRDPSLLGLGSNPEVTLV